jgi:hypothetical protein
MHPSQTRSERFRLLVAVAAASLLVACGNDSDPTDIGTPDAQVPDGDAPDGVVPMDPDPLANGTFIKRIEGTGSLVQPFGESAGARIMFLLHADDVAASGELSALRLERTGEMEEAIVCPGVTLRAGHSSVTDLAQAFDDNVEEGKGSVAVVLEDAEITIPAGDGGELFEIAFDAPFAYNGVDNLVIEAVRTSPCTGTMGLRTQGSAGYTGIRWGAPADAELGTAYANRLSTHLVFDGGDNRVIAEDGEDWGFANFLSPDGTRLQLLILARDIEGEGPITGIRFPTQAVDDPRTVTYSMTLSHVDQEVEAFDTAVFDENIGSDALEVAADTTMVIAAGATELWMPVSDAFDYDGASNLLIDIRVPTASHAVQFSRFGVDAPRIVAILDADAVEGTLHDITVEPTLRFHGATINRTLEGSAALDGGGHTFTDNVTGRTSQQLYYGTELGTGGTITRMACRFAGAASSMTAYPDFEVIMSHTDALELGPDFDDNLPAPAVVHQGAFTVPDGLLLGDWIEIPLDEGFTYDATQNLVIQVRNGGGEAVHGCLIAQDEARYENRFVEGTSSTSLSGTVWPMQRALRLWIER